MHKVTSESGNNGGIEHEAQSQKCKSTDAAKDVQIWLPSQD